jgi:hypothetical protein
MLTDGGRAAHLAPGQRAKATIYRSVRIQQEMAAFGLISGLSARSVPRSYGRANETNAPGCER